MARSKVELFEQIRRDRRIEELSIRELAERYRVHRRTVRQALASALPPPRKAYPRRPRPAIDPYSEVIDSWLLADRDMPRKQRHTARRVWQRLVAEHGATLAEVTVSRYVTARRAELGLHRVEVAVPQAHRPGAEAEVDFGEFAATIAGVLTTLWLFVMRLSRSGKAFHVAFATQAQEAFLEGHVAAFQYFGGVPARIRYDNLKPAVVRMLRGRDRTESERFTAPADSPTTAGMSSFGQSGFQEGNAAQYTWSVPQDLHGLITALGGNAAAVSRLDSFFTYLNAGPNQPYEWAGNEPSFGTPWIYDYAGAPYKAQPIVHELLTSAYADAPGGEPGYDDLGAMSSWLVWSSIGLYPQTSGAAVLDVGAPIFPRVQLNVPHGHPVTITAPGANASTYVQSLSVDGRSWSDDRVPAGSITGDGGPTTLCFAMGSAPNTSWGAAEQDVPPSYEAAPLTFPPGRTPIVLVPSGPNLLGSTPTGQLDWQGPVEKGSAPCRARSPPRPRRRAPARSTGPNRTRPRTPGCTCSRARN